MIVITVELWPHGNKEKRKMLGVGVIVNDGSGTNDIGNYMSNFSLTTHKWTRDARIEGFPRLKLNAWHLIKYALGGALK